MKDIVNKPLILFFIDSAVPTIEQRKEALEYDSAKVVFRNATKVTNSDFIENCDGVMGNVPKLYSKLPSADKAIENYKRKLFELFERVGDEKAPNSKAEVISKQLNEESEEQSEESEKSSRKNWGGKK